MEKHTESFDFILDTVSAEHDLNAYLNLLRRDGNLTIVGAPPKPLRVDVMDLISRRRSFSGSMIGGIAETQQMLDFCGKHNIAADVEIIPVQKMNEAYERLLKSDVKYRFSIDMGSRNPNKRMGRRRDAETQTWKKQLLKYPPWASAAWE